MIKEIQNELGGIIVNFMRHIYLFHIHMYVHCNTGIWYNWIYDVKSGGSLFRILLIVIK